MAAQKKIGFLDESVLVHWNGPDLPSLEGYLGLMAAVKASDLFLRANSSPAFRVAGRVVRTEWPMPTADEFAGYLERILTPVARERFQESPDIDAAFVLPGVGRFRINLFMQQGNLALAARHIPSGAVEFETLGLPASVLEMAGARAGLILVTGPTGSGKSTTLASLIHHINQTREGHIVTIEDPIEFVHDELRCLIHQRQVGYDTESFDQALRHVVRQSPDVILIGEMRDDLTIKTAMAAALTGHLVLSTLHTNSVIQSIERILGYFPAAARPQIQANLAATLVGITAMRLLPKADGQGSVAAVEVLRASASIRKNIAEGNLTGIHESMSRSLDAGMTTLTRSLVRLCKQKLITFDVGLANAPNPDEFRLNMQGMFTGVDSINLGEDGR